MPRFNVKLSGKLGGALRKAKRLGAAEDLPDDTRTYPTTEGIEEFADSENWMNRPDWQAVNMLMQRDEVMSRMYEEGRMRGFSKGVVSMVARDLLKKNWLSLDPGESHYSYTPDAQEDYSSYPGEPMRFYGGVPTEDDISYDDSDPDDELSPDSPLSPQRGPSVEEYLSRSRARLPKRRDDIRESSAYIEKLQELIDKGKSRPPFDPKEM